MSKKLLALILSMLLLLSGMSLGAAAEGEAAAADAPAADITAAPAEGIKAEYFGEYDEAIKALQRFGILAEEGFDPMAKVTRGGFLGRAMLITGIGEMPAPEEPIFTDVLANDENAGAIAAAYQMGIAAGVGDGKFNPSGTLTAEQAAKILVTLLGYEVHALAYGGYPGGYLVVATTEGVLKNVKVGDYDELTWGIAAQLIYNAMNADVLQRESYPDGAYKTCEGENPMTLWMGIYNLRAQVLATEETALNSAQGCSEGYVKIGDELMLENGALPEDIIGCTVDAYYKIDEADRKVLLNALPIKTTKRISAAADMISPNSSARSLVIYSEDYSADVNYPISAAPVSIYNGKYAPLTDEMIKPSYGTVSITDTNGDGIYEKVTVWQSRVLIAKTVSPKTGIIKDKNEIYNIDLDVDNLRFNLSVIKDGKEATLSDIKENDVLVVEESVDGLNVKITACTDRLRGKIGEVSDEEILLDGTTFKVVPGLESVFAAIKPGEEATFYFTHDYKLAGFGDVSKGNTDYGYLLTGGVPIKGLATSAAQLKIFTVNGGVKDYEAAEKVTLNGSVTNAEGKKYQGEVLMQALADASECYQIFSGVISQPEPASNATIKSYFCNQVIKFATNDEGKVTNIETAFDNRLASGGTGAYYEDGLSLDYSTYSNSLTPPAEGKTLSYGSGSYSGQESNILASLYILPDTTAWKIPNFDTWKSYYDGDISIETMEKYFGTFTPSNTWEANTSYGNLAVYDVNSSRVGGLLVQGVAGATEAVADLEFFLVDRVVTALDEEGYETKRLYGLYRGKEVNYPIDFTSSQLSQRPELATTLTRGDIIRVAISTTGSVTFIRRIFTMADFDPEPYNKQVEIYKSYNKEQARVFFLENYGIELSQGSTKDTNPEVKKLLTNWSEWFLYGNVFDDWYSPNGATTTGYGGGYTDWYHRSEVPQTLWYQHSSKSGSKPIFSWNTVHNIVHGKVTGRTGDVFTINLGIAEDGTEMSEKLVAAHYKYAKYYVYDEAEDKVYIGKASDIDPDDPCQTVVFRNRYQAFWECVIINHAEPMVDVPWKGEYID